MSCEPSADKQQPKRTRIGLPEANERRRPNYLDVLVVNVVQSTTRILDKNGRPTKASNVRFSRNHRGAMRSKFQGFLREAELEEMVVLRANGVIEEIPEEAVPIDAKLINTRWMYALKSDHEGFVGRFKARISPLVTTKDRALTSWRHSPRGTHVILPIAGGTGSRVAPAALLR
ncbi:hypothetical protein PF002_g16718 [Phytophthora fragariae]|uniref:Uncharacterized protein n=1 Tax=Phytophthora fragariae TaxID=53985 RepID=A0A6A3RPS1_9STRA|nr:hypothetical protein PF007_g15638 [Phytophthora fragariae]KAE9217700.1 hypothetical protein PF002_g16718 [Phytophthora fragariae]